MGKYDAERVHKRVDYIQYIYKNKDYPNNFEDFILPIAVYSRNGTIAGVNKIFRKLTKITEDDLQLEKANIFSLLNEKETGLAEAAHNAFDGKEKVYKGAGSLIQTTEDNPGKYELSRYPNAIFFPMSRDKEGYKLVGVLLDDNKTNDDTG
jgi:hypothetical protein